MKLPTTNGSGNGYYGHDISAVLSFMPEAPGGTTNAIESPQPNGDFSEYMWMENEEEFDKQVMQQLEEEALMEQCMEAMLEDEQYERNITPCHYARNNEASWSNGVANGRSTSEHTNGTTPDLCQGMRSLRVQDLAVKSTLNPNAAEFVPNFAPAAVSAVTTAPDSKSSDS